MSGIFEKMWRNDVAAFNERQRDGYYVSALQKLGPDDDVMGAWAHAANTPGDPGAGPIDNTADMLAVGLRHWFNPKTTIIASYAHMRNSTAAHYALGPGGHGVTWDCKDGGTPMTASPGPGIGLIRQRYRLLHRNQPTGVFAGHDVRLLRAAGPSNHLSL